MILRLITTLLVLLLSYSVKSQDQHVTGGERSRTIDSLKSVIKEAGHDTSVCDAYLSWGEQVYLISPDTALVLWQKAHDIAKRELADGPSDGEAGLETKYLWILAGSMNNIGYIYDDQGNIDKALEFYQKGLKIQEELGDKDGIATSLNNIGYTYKGQGDIDKALEFFHKSLKIYEEVGNKTGVALALNNIGLIHLGQEDMKTALEFFYKSLDIHKETGEQSRIAVALGNIGYIYKQQGKIDKALEYHHESLKIREEIEDKNGMAYSLGHIAVIFYNNGDWEKALEYHNKGLQLSEEIGFKKGQAFSLNNIGIIYLEMNDVSKAKKYIRKSMKLARELGFPNDIKGSAKLLSKAFKMEGDFEQALEMYELFILMRDSINNEATQKATIRQQTKYEFEKAQLVKDQEEREAARVEAEVMSRRDNLQYSVIFIAILVLFGGVLALGFINVSERMAEGIIFFSFLILFEFLLVLADPYIDRWSGGAPGIKLLFNAGIAALIFPLHSLFESKLKSRLVKAKQDV